MSGIQGSNGSPRGTGKIQPPSVSQPQNTPGVAPPIGCASGDSTHLSALAAKGTAPLVPGHPRSITDAVIETFQRGYTPPPVPGDEDVGKTPDGGIVQGDDYVRRKDPLKANVCSGGVSASVCLGVDPGTFFCGGQAKLLADLKRSHPGLQTGFIHVPPDQQTGVVSAGHATRPENLAMMAQVLGRTVRGLAGESGDRTILLTGYGAFENVPDNPTQAFLQTRGGELNKANLDRVMIQAFGPWAAAKSVPLTDENENVVGYRYTLGNRQIALLGGTMQMAPDVKAAIAGKYYADMGPVATQFNQLFDQAILANRGRTPDAVISLGVDSTQRDLKPGQKPSFRIETQAQGFYQDAPDRNFAPVPVANHDLARAWMRA